MRDIVYEKVSIHHFLNLGTIFCDAGCDPSFKVNLTPAQRSNFSRFLLVRGPISRRFVYNETNFRKRNDKAPAGVLI